MSSPALPGDGHAEVRRFFEGILARLEITAFNTDEFVAEGDTVVIFGSEAGRCARRDSRSATSGCRGTSCGAT